MNLKDDNRESSNYFEESVEKEKLEKKLAEKVTEKRGGGK